MPADVRIVEVGPRDGLQNEKAIIPAPVKIGYIDRLSQAGFRSIEVTSFVSPKAIPQLADAAEVAGGITRLPGVSYSALVPNERGMERAIAVDLDEIAVFTAASESFTRANIRMTIAESLVAFTPVIEQAREHGMRVRGYVSTAFGCPYEGEIAPAAVLQVTQALLDLGVDEISIGDTIGVATPAQVRSLVPQLLALTGVGRLALHMHDTRGTALANILAALDLGVTIFDSASGGLGGCPYAPGAAGNVATEDVLYMLHGMGVQTGIDLDQVVAATRYLSEALGRSIASKYYQAATARG